MMKRRSQILAIALAVIALAGAAACQPAAAPATGASQTGTSTTATAAPKTLFLMTDVVQGSKNIPDDQKAARSCVLSSRFPRNSEVVWRTRVFDPATGNLMDDKDLAKVEVRLANGTTIAMKYGPHPKDPPGESYWTGSWVVPKDHPTGVLEYTVIATATDGRTGEFKPFSVKASLPAITEEVLADIPPKS